MKRDYDTYLVHLTVGDLIEILKDKFPALTSPDKGTIDPQSSDEPTFTGRLVYGIKGIEDIFHVSHKTAQEWKNTWLAPAVRQSGRKIVTDVSYAFKLFDKCEKKR